MRESVDKEVAFMFPSVFDLRVFFFFKKKKGLETALCFAYLASAPQITIGSSPDRGCPVNPVAVPLQIRARVSLQECRFRRQALVRPPDEAHSKFYQARR